MFAKIPSNRPILWMMDFMVLGVHCSTKIQKTRIICRIEDGGQSSDSMNCRKNSIESSEFMDDEMVLGAIHVHGSNYTPRFHRETKFICRIEDNKLINWRKNSIESSDLKYTKLYASIGQRESLSLDDKNKRIYRSFTRKFDRIDRLPGCTTS